VSLLIFRLQKGKKRKYLNSFALYILLTIFSVFISIHNTFCQVIKYDTKITVEESGKKITERTIRLLIKDKQANSLSHIIIGHNPMQRFIFNYAYIIDPDGKIIRKIKKKDITTRNDLSYVAFYQDDLISEFDLYWNEYPYQVEYSYTISEKEYTRIVWWTPAWYLNLSTKEASLQIDIPSNFKLNIKQSSDLNFKEANTENKVSYLWKSSYQPKINNEIYSPTTLESIPFVYVVPDQFKYGNSGNSNSWSSLGSWVNELNKGTDQLTLDEKNKLKYVLDGTQDKREIIKKLYYYMQDHTTYVNVSIDVGGLKSYPASYVCQNKYGDCKALTTYMKALLKSEGIESIYTIINAGKNSPKINSDFPSLQFNHVILLVPLEDDTIWLENTSNTLPFNYLGTFTQDRYTLAVNGEKSTLIKTPKLKPVDVLVERDFNFELNEDSYWQSNISLTLRGSSFEDFRNNLFYDNESDLELKLKTYLDIDGFELDSWKILSNNRDSSNIKVQLSGESPNSIREIGKWEVIKPLRIVIPDFEDPNERELAVRINYPINESNKSTYHLNKLEINEIKLPEAVVINSNYGNYSSEYLLFDRTIIVIEKFTLFANDIPLDNYPEFYSFINSIKNHKKKSAILLQ